MNNLAALIGILCVFIIHKPLGVYSEAEEECDPNVVADLNKRIEETLSQYPEKPVTALMLSVMYNENYKILTSFTKMNAPKTRDCENVEKHLKHFIELASDYDNVVPKLEEAFIELKKIDTNPDQELHLRYDALKVRTLITFLTTIHDAEKALKGYEDFKKEHNIVKSGEKSDKKSSKEADE